MDEILNRINFLMEKEGIPPSELADKIGIGRPLLSHVLSGRNKPSLQLVLKILAHFPSYSANWLLTGKENDTPSQSESTKAANATPETRENMPEETKHEAARMPATAAFTTDAELVLVMYGDKTYETYKPRK